MQEAFFAAAEFVALLFGDRDDRALLHEAIPEVLDELQTFREAKFEERSEFGVHDAYLYGRMTERSKRVCDQLAIRVGDEGRTKSPAPRPFFVRPGGTPAILFGRRSREGNQGKSESRCRETVGE
jgi:hypothetical protein